MGPDGSTGTDRAPRADAPADDDGMPAPPDTLHVGVLGGTRLPGNVRTFLRNLRELLADHPTTFRFDLLLRAGAEDPPEGYRGVDPGIERTDRAVATIRSLTGAATAYARERRPDLLAQVTKFPVHGTAATVAGLRTGTPVLTRLAGDNFREHRLSSGLADRARTILLNNAFGRVPVHGSDLTIVLGPHGRREIRRRRSGARVRTIPQPVDRDRFSPVNRGRRAEIRKSVGVGPDTRLLLTVGRVSRRKGAATVARAARVLARQDVACRWLVVGDGPLRDRLADVPLVEPVGRVAHDRMADYYRAADLVVHPSLIEGLPNVLLEAAACGTPSLARDVGDCAVAASRTFAADADPARVASLALAEYEAASLDAGFDPDRLRVAYADALIAAVGGAGATGDTSTETDDIGTREA